MSTVTNIVLQIFFSLSLFYGQWRISRNERDGTGDAKRIVRGECDRCFSESLADEGAALGFRVCAKLAQNSLPREILIGMMEDWDSIFGQLWKPFFDSCSINLL